jgi:hypothetical protein
MSKRYLLNIYFINIYIILGIFFLYNSSFADSNVPQKNGLILDSLTKEISKSLIDFYTFLTGKNIVIKINDLPASSLIINQILINNKSVGMIIHKPDDSASSLYSKLELFVKDYSVNYYIYPKNNDSLIRQFNISIESSIIGKIASDTNAVRTNKISYTDTISRQDIPYIENPEYKFAYMPLPKPQRTFWQDITQPVLIITTAIITIILLFTVRSG